MMPGRDDTEIGGPSAGFPSTRWSMLRDARDRQSPAYVKAIDDLCRIYWKPAYVYLRSSRSMTNDQAKDLTQEFLLEIVDGDLLTRYSPDHGSFRSYLRGALRLFLLEEHRESSALKRGGGRTFVPLDGELDALAGSSGDDPDKLFDRQWADAVLEQAVTSLRDELRSSGREVAFRVFERYELNPPPGGPPGYAELARDFQVKETDVSNYLQAGRTRLRELVVARIRDYVSSESEAAAEFLRLFAR